MGTWDWSGFVGTERGLYYNRRDLVDNLEPVIALSRQRRVVVQAGGNLGIFPKRLAEVFEAVYTFEPDPDNFLALCHNAPEPNVVKFQAALGAGPELVGISRERIDGRAETHEGTRNVKGKGIIPVLCVDDFGFETCDLLYLDLEGYELFALTGAKETIRRCRPLVVVEVNKSICRYGLTEDDVFNHMRLVDYRQVQKHHSDYVFVPAEWKQ